jgi:geranylgeranylglycerol-phosphate geranylgeranyltransferase
MNSEKVKAFVQLSRPLNLLITVLSIPVACWIAGGTTHDWLSIVLAALTGVFVAAGANAINDAFDIDIDRINRPDRPLPRGALTQLDARRLWLVVSSCAMILNLFINLLALFIVVNAVIILYFYSAKLKRTVFIGNLVVALMTGMAFIYGGSTVGSIKRAVVPALFAFLINLARELIKDVEDIAGDRREHAMTLPIHYGIKPALALATLFLLLLISTTVLAVQFSMYQISFFYIVLAADILILSTIGMMWYNDSPKQMRRVSNTLKMSMMIGLAAIIVGSL